MVCEIETIKLVVTGDGDAIEPDSTDRDTSQCIATRGNDEQFYVKDVITPRYGYAMALIQPPATQNEKQFNAVHNISLQTIREERVQQLRGEVVVVWWSGMGVVEVEVQMGGG